MMSLFPYVEAMFYCISGAILSKAINMDINTCFLILIMTVVCRIDNKVK